MRPTILKSAAALLAFQLVGGFTGILAGTPSGAPQPAGRSGVAPASRADDPNVRNYHVTASDGGIIPGHIRLRKGEKVRITFVSKDDKYAIRFKDFGVKESLTPERPIVIEISPGRAGTYVFRCARAFGIKRFGNNGTLVVTE